MNTQEQIEQLEKQLSELKEKARIEHEEAQKKRNAERDAELMSIMNQIKDFNKKYDDHISLATSMKTDTGRVLAETFFPWL